MWGGGAEGRKGSRSNSDIEFRYREGCELRQEQSRWREGPISEITAEQNRLETVTTYGPQHTIFRLHDGMKVICAQ